MNQFDPYHQPVGSITDMQARAALERLKRRLQESSDIPSPKAQSALAIITELEQLLDLPE